MKCLRAAVAVLAVAVGSWLVVGVEAEQTRPSPPATSADTSASWTVPRLPDGTPDLSGVWGNNSVTPMARPRQWQDKSTLSDAELEELKQYAQQFVDQGGDAIFGNFVQLLLDAKDAGTFRQLSYDPTTGNYNQFWMADREWDHRTALITDPPDGQFPALTPEATARRAERAAAAKASTRGPADGPEDRPLSERCISYGAPRTQANYNSYTQIIQSPKAVVLLQEMIHDARVVDMTGTPHLPAQIRQLHGDSRGRWDGDSLVVETSNYLNGFQGSTPAVTLTERYTRVSPEFINWEVTVDDPATWVTPYTFMVRLKKTDGLIYEYACHEGNYAMTGMLAGARKQEAEARGRRVR